MKKIIFIMGGLLSVIFLLAGCGQKDDSELNVEKHLNEAVEKNSTRNANYWPEWIPAEIPPYKYGDYAMDTPFDNGGMVYFSNIDMQKDPFNSYMQELQKKGWEVEIIENDIVDDLAHFDHPEGHFLSYSVDTEEDWVILTIDMESDNSSAETKKDPRTVTMENEIDNVKITQSNEVLPRGFDEELCPFYQPSKLEFSQDASLGGTDEKLYSIALTTKDSFDDVVMFYEKLAPESTTIIAPNLMAAVLLGDDNFDDYACSINIVNDEEKAETSIGITLSIN